jgi:hypothetical protein
MVAKIYADVDVKLHRVTAGAVESHLKKPARDNRVRERAPPSAPSRRELL